MRYIVKILKSAYECLTSIVRSKASQLEIKTEMPDESSGRELKKEGDKLRPFLHYRNLTNIADSKFNR